MAYYDYQKAFDKVHHNWMVKVCTWMEYPENFVKIIGTMMEKWRTRLEVCRDKKTEISIWITTKYGFLQKKQFFFLVRYCLTEVPVAMLLTDSEGYRMGPPGKRNIRNYL